MLRRRAGKGLDPSSATPLRTSFDLDHVEHAFDRREPDVDPIDDAIASEQQCRGHAKPRRLAACRIGAGSRSASACTQASTEIDDTQQQAHAHERYGHDQIERRDGDSPARDFRGRAPITGLTSSISEINYTVYFIYSADREACQEQRLTSACSY